jgi:hypothetical protein
MMFSTGFEFTVHDAAVLGLALRGMSQLVELSLGL